MKRLGFLLLSSFLCFCGVCSKANVRQISCKVVGISDGDTLTCLYDRAELKVRLLYIDAPESAQPFGNRAKQALATMAFKKNVSLTITGYDKYRRVLAVVHNEKNENLNLKLVELGMAWAYRQTQPLYQQAQQQAQRAKIGLWQDKNPIDPSEWRANKRSVSPNILQKSPNNRPLASNIDCSAKISCSKMEKQGLSYAHAERYFRQCGWKELDGNNDGIPCNRLYRKAQKQ